MVTPKQALQKYGNPELELSMVPWVIPVSLRISSFPQKIYCNKDMVIPLSKALVNIIDRNLSSEIKTFDGCFNIRKIKGSVSQSLHSWGLAIDINASYNQMGKIPMISNELVKCFTDAGFDWGGNFKRKDGMHFQIAKI